jgi:hypothetical protein
MAIRRKRTSIEYTLTIKPSDGLWSLRQFSALSRKRADDAVRRRAVCLCEYRDAIDGPGSLRIEDHVVNHMGGWFVFETARRGSALREPPSGPGRSELPL